MPNKWCVLNNDVCLITRFYSTSTTAPSGYGSTLRTNDETPAGDATLDPTVAGTCDRETDEYRCSSSPALLRWGQWSQQ